MTLPNAHYATAFANKFMSIVIDTRSALLHSITIYSRLVNMKPTAAH